MKQEHLGKLIIEAGHATRKSFESYFEAKTDDPLKPVAGRVFGYLAKHPDCSSQDIQNEFSLSKATVSECLSSLLERGYISYTKSKEDAREKKITLTEAGLARSQWYDSMVNEFEEIISRDFTPEEIEELRCLLEKIKQKTEDMDYGR